MASNDDISSVPLRPKISLNLPKNYTTASLPSGKYTPNPYYFHPHSLQSPTRLSVKLHPETGVPITVPITSANDLPPEWPEYYTMYPAKAGDFMFKQFEGFRDFTLNTAKSGLSVGEKSVYWLYCKLSKWSRSWFTHIFLFLVLFLYSIAGGFVFLTVEGTHERHVEANITQAKVDLAKSLRQLALDTNKLYREDPEIWEGRAINLVEEYSTVLYEAFRREAYESKKNKKKTWTFWNSVFYCGTIYTTIGYGHISPSTTTGRALTILYAIIGIPIFLMVLADFGKLFTRGIKFVWSYVRRLYYTGSLRKVRKTVQVQEMMKGLNTVYDFVRRPSHGVTAEQHAEHTDEDNPATPMTPPSTNLNAPPPSCDTPTTPVPEIAIDDEFNLPITLAIFILVAYMLFGASIYFMWEDWSFFEAFYFVFISISTIGFGDYVPQHPIFMMCSIIYLIFGLALTSMCINVVQIKLSDSFRLASSKIGATIGFQMAEAASLQQSQSQVHTPVEIASVHGTTPSISVTTIEPKESPKDAKSKTP